MEATSEGFRPFFTAKATARNVLGLAYAVAMGITDKVVGSINGSVGASALSVPAPTITPATKESVVSRLEVGGTPSGAISSLVEVFKAPLLAILSVILTVDGPLQAVMGTAVTNARPVGA